MKYICVFCSSSDALDDCFYSLADSLGKNIAANGFGLVYGGANVGLMKRLSVSVRTNGGKTIGIIPQKIADKGLVCKDDTEIIVTKDMHERKAKLAENADAFVTLPGGFGTLEEFLEIVTLKQLAYHNKPIVLINYKGFYDNLIRQFGLFYNKNFAKRVYENLFYIAENEKDTMKYILNYDAKIIDDKWFDVSKREFGK